jgi:DNA-binding transcriptional LysR family regulator
MVKLDGVATFLAVAEAGSISEAARRLKLSKSVASDRLVELERSLGVRLVHRSTRRLSLTEDGITFRERASRIANEVEEALAEMAERSGAPGGPCASRRLSPSAECISAQRFIRLSPSILASS